MIWDRDTGSVPTIRGQFLPPHPCETALALHCQTQMRLDFTKEC